MADAGEVKIKVVVDDSTATSQGDAVGKKVASGINQQLDQTQQNTGKTANAMQAMLTGKVAGALLNTAKRIAKFGVEYNSKMQDYMTNFTTMLGDASKAQTFVTSLKDMAAKTPFGMDDLAGASQTLLAFGIDANKVQGDLQMLGDVSMGNKDRFNSLSLAFAQIQSTGKLAGQDLLQLVNAGFNPLNEISKKTGRSIADLKEDMSKGLITADMVTDAFKSATSEGGTFYNGMAAASQTLSGKLSTLKDDVSALAGQVMEQAMPMLQTVVGWASQAVAWMSQHPALVKNIGIALIVLIGTLGMFSGALAIAQGAVAIFGGTVGAVFWPITLIAAAVAALAALFIATGGDMGNFGTVLQNVWDTVWTFLQGIFTKIGEWIANFPETLANFLAEIGPKVLDWIEHLGEWIGKIPGIVADLIVKLLQYLATVDWGKVAKDALDWIVRTIGTMQSFVWQAIVALVRGIIRSFEQTDWASIGRNIIDGIIRGIQNMAGNLWNAAVDAAKNAFNAAKNWLGIASPSKKFKFIGQMSMAGFGTGIEDKLPDVTQTMTRSVQDVYSAASIPTASSLMPGFNFSGLSDYFNAKTSSTVAQGIDSQAIAAAVKQGAESANLSAYLNADKVADSTTNKTNVNMNIITKRQGRYGQ